MITNEVFQKKQSVTSFTIEELENMYVEGKIKLRETNIGQVRQIRRYLLDNASEGNIYFPPLVAYKKDGEPADTLTIIDGTQRMKAFLNISEWAVKLLYHDDINRVKNASKLLDLLKNMEIAVQVFEGLSEKDANQMFIDFNTKGKKVALSKRIAFDSRNEINQITNAVLQHNTMLRVAGVEKEKRSLIRPRNKKFISLSQLRQVIGIFLTGKVVKNEGKNLALTLQLDEYLELIDLWLNELFELYPAETIGDYEDSMLASFTLLTAVAMYAVENTNELSYPERTALISKRMQDLKDVNWSRSNPEWFLFEGSERGAYKYFFLNHNKKNIGKLVEWLKQKGE